MEGDYIIGLNQGKQSVSLEPGGQCLEHMLCWQMSGPILNNWSLVVNVWNNFEDRAFSLLSARQESY